VSTASLTVPDQAPYQAVFQRILDEFKATLKPKHEKSFKMTTLDELNQAVVDIQAKQRSERRQKNMRRLDGFLEGMKQYDKVVQIFCNGNEFVAFVWVRFSFLSMRSISNLCLGSYKVASSGNLHKTKSLLIS
jgi:hypothetical protein